MEARDFILIKNQANTMNADGITDDGNCEYNWFYFTLAKRSHASEHWIAYNEMKKVSEMIAYFTLTSQG